MTSNGVNGSGKPSRSDDAVLKLFNKSDFTEHTIKLKSPSRKAAKRPPLNWQQRANQLDTQDDKPSPSNSTGKSPGPVVTQLDEKDISTFATGRPLQDKPDYTVCKHCKKPVIKSAAVAHIKACLKAKSDKAKERKKLKEEKAAAAAAKDKDKDKGDPVDAVVEAPVEEIKKGAKKTSKKDGDGAKGKKRKADEPKVPKEPKAKKRKEKPARAEPKAKAPVDVEKQCGVQLPNGALCARSLTCKSHPMGAKRSVLGRSQPYDALLAAYQKKNQARQQKAAINAEAPPPDEIEANAIPVDSDEETEQVMAAVARACPQPMDRQYMIPVRRKYQYVRMREMLASALRPAGYPSEGYMSNGNSTGNVFDAGMQNGAPPPPPAAQRQSIGGAGQNRQFQPPPQPQRKGSVNVG